jgi:hypothetical protein
LPELTPYSRTGAFTAVYNKLISKKYFDKYGIKMSYVVPGSKTKTFDFHAFLQPLRYKNKLYLSGVPTELGYDGLNKYLLICPPEINIKDIDGINCRLCLGDEAFGVDHYETVYRFGKAFYLWAIIHKEG